MKQFRVKVTMRRLLLLFISFVFAEKCNGILKIVDEKKHKIDDFMNSLFFSCEKHRFAGVNLAIVHQGEIVYTTGYGVRNLGKNLNSCEDYWSLKSGATYHLTTVCASLLA